MKQHSENSVAVSFQLDLRDSKNVDDDLASFSVSVKFDQEQVCSAVLTPSVTIATVESNTSEGDAATCSNNTNEANPEQKQNDEVAVCPDCNEKLSDTIELSIHRMRRHTVKRKDATCLLCDNKSFSSAEEYEQHVLDRSL